MRYESVKDTNLKISIEGDDAVFEIPALVGEECTRRFGTVCVEIVETPDGNLIGDARSGDILSKIGEEKVLGWGALDDETGIMVKADGWSHHVTIPSSVINHLVLHHGLRGYYYRPEAVSVLK